MADLDLDALEELMKVRSSLIKQQLLIARRASEQARWRSLSVWRR
jgi:hypothetical protein